MECHGTGTALGDPIETGALKATLAQGLMFWKEWEMILLESDGGISHLDLA